MIADSCRSLRRVALTAFAAVLSMQSIVAVAADAAAPTTEKCLQINRIQNTKVVDQNTVLFYMVGNEVYKNVLPHPCGSLRTDEAFSYKSSINQLCSVDTISPLVSTGGTYTKMASCGLGTFERIDKASATKLISDAKAARGN